MWWVKMWLIVAIPTILWLWWECDHAPEYPWEYDDPDDWSGPGPE
jgi:hypothetical protein